MLIIVFFLCFAVFRAQYQIPDANVIISQPKGFKISIPGNEGIQKVTFYASINKELKENAKDLVRKEVVNPLNGFWMIEDNNIAWNIGDVLYYQIKVVYFDGKETVTLDKSIQKLTIKTTANVPAMTPAPPCEYTPTMVNGKRSCKGKLIFHDLFNDLSEKRWKTEIRYAGEPDYEFVIYQDDPQNLYISKNMIHLTPTLVETRLGPGFVSDAKTLDLGENCTGIMESYQCMQTPKAWFILPPVFASQISTKDRFSFVYGVVEIRAKLPKGDWIYPQLYLKSKNDFYGDGYDSGLLKIAYAPGNTDMNRILSGGGVLGESAFARYYAIKSTQSTKEWSKDFHIFKLEWRPDGISLIVDNEVYGNVYPPDGGFVMKHEDLKIDSGTAERWRKGSEMAPFDKEMYLIFGVGVGGVVFPNRKDGKKPWNNEDPKGQLHFYRSVDTWYKTWTHIEWVGAICALLTFICTVQLVLVGFLLWAIPGILMLTKSHLATLAGLIAGLITLPAVIKTPKMDRIYGYTLCYQRLTVSIAAMLHCIAILLAFYALLQTVKLGSTFKKLMKTYEIKTSSKVLVDNIQFAFDCCGGYSYADWKQMSLETEALDEQDQRINSVPFSCCSKIVFAPCNNKDLTFGLKTINTDGCGLKLGKFIHTVLWLELILYLVSFSLEVAILGLLGDPPVENKEADNRSSSKWGTFTNMSSSTSSVWHSSHSEKKVSSKRKK
ncbi:hypothetical protein FQR65_LT10644 [Abscondita terminalis]|nr:hypothetical protein FQR65_LT10644 [Abscondita terminalis]